MSGLPAVINNPQEDLRYDAEVDSRYLPRLATSVLVVPLPGGPASAPVSPSSTIGSVDVAGNIMGVLAFFRIPSTSQPDPAPFTAADVSIAAATAAQFSALLRSKRDAEEAYRGAEELHEALSATRAELQKMHSEKGELSSRELLLRSAMATTLALAGAMDHDQVALIVQEQVKNLVGATACTLWRKSGNSFRLLGANKVSVDRAASAAGTCAKMKRPYVCHQTGDRKVHKVSHEEVVALFSAEDGNAKGENVESLLQQSTTSRRLLPSFAMVACVPVFNDRGDVVAVMELAKSAEQNLRPEPQSEGLAPGINRRLELTEEDEGVEEGSSFSDHQLQVLSTMGRHIFRALARISTFDHAQQAAAQAMRSHQGTLSRLEAMEQEFDRTQAQVHVLEWLVRHREFNASEGICGGLNCTKRRSAEFSSTRQH